MPSSLRQRVARLHDRLRNPNYGLTSFALTIGERPNSVVRPRVMVCGNCHLLGPGTPWLEGPIGKDFDRSFVYLSGLSVAEALATPIETIVLAAPALYNPSPRWLPKVVELAEQDRPQVVVIQSGAADYLPGLIYRLLRLAPVALLDDVAELLRQHKLEWLVQDGQRYVVRRPKRFFPYVRVTGLRHYCRSLRSTLKGLAALGIGVVVVGPFARGGEAWVRHLDRFNEATRAIALRGGAAFLDAFHLLNHPARGFLHDDVHLTTSGHAALGEALSPLVAAGLRARFGAGAAATSADRGAQTLSPLGAVHG